jgi:hypothetical protein
MGYFPNGTAGDLFEEQHCSRCVHRGHDGTGCNVMLAHILFSYTLCDKPGHEGKQILDLLIPEGERSCSMFHEGRPPPAQLSLDRAVCKRCGLSHGSHHGAGKLPEACDLFAAEGAKPLAQALEEAEAVNAAAAAVLAAHARGEA